MRENNLYQYSDLVVASNLNLPELTAVSHSQPTHTFHLCPDIWPQETAVSYTHHWQAPNGQITLSYARYKDGFLLRFPDTTTFVISADGTEICCYPAAGIPKATIRHYLLDQVLPRILSQQGRLVIHASAFVGREGVVLFLGDSGWGKSTLVADFYTNGFPLLADDCVIIAQEEQAYNVLPSYFGLRLCPDTVESLAGSLVNLPHTTDSQVAHYSQKKRMIMHEPQAVEPLPLRGVCLLTAPQSVAADTPVTLMSAGGSEAMMSAIAQTFALDMADQTQTAVRFQAVANLVTAVPCYRLIYPRRRELLPTVREKILATFN